MSDLVSKRSFHRKRNRNCVKRSRVFCLFICYVCWITASCFEKEQGIEMHYKTRVHTSPCLQWFTFTTFFSRCSVENCIWQIWRNIEQQAFARTPLLINRRQTCIYMDVFDSEQKRKSIFLKKCFIGYPYVTMVFS